MITINPHSAMDMAAQARRNQGIDRWSNWSVQNTTKHQTDSSFDALKNLQGAKLGAKIDMRA